MIRISGIADVWNHKCFDFISQTDFIELVLYALGGKISVVILSKNFDFNIKRGDYVTLEGILSLDIAINTNDNIGDFSVNEYTELIEKIDDKATPWPYKYGINPSFANTKKIIIDAILTKDYSKIRRCCEAKHISYRLIDILSNLENNITHCEIKHILDSPNKYALGHEAVLIYDGEELMQALWLDRNDYGQIYNFELLDINNTTFGIDKEFHLLTMVSMANTYHKPRLLKEYLVDNCKYRSEYSNTTILNSNQIISWLIGVGNAISLQEEYYSEILLSENELLIIENLPDIYKGKYCIKSYQGNELAYYVFITYNDDNKITNILLSRDPNYLKAFKKEEKKLDVHKDRKFSYDSSKIIKEIRSKQYCNIDSDTEYIQKKTDELLVNWLKRKSYKIEDSFCLDDCLAYTCSYGDKKYLVCFYSCDDIKNANLSEKTYDYLRDYDIAKDREILIAHIAVEKVIKKNGKSKYYISSFYAKRGFIELFRLTRVQDRDILVYFARPDVWDLVFRFVAAYNSKDYDLLRAIMHDYPAFYDKGRASYPFRYQHVYGGFMKFYRDNGPMKIAYVNYYDNYFNLDPYVEDVGFVSIYVDESSKITNIVINSLNRRYGDVIFEEDPLMETPLNYVPVLKKVEFMSPSENIRMALLLEFENGEKKIFDITESSVDHTTFKYRDKIFTYHIFKSVKIIDKIFRPESYEFIGFAERGQGVEFSNGVVLSTVELYHNSHPYK